MKACIHLAICYFHKHVNRNNFPSGLQVSVPRPNPPLRNKVDDEIDRNFFRDPWAKKAPVAADYRSNVRPGGPA